jgi:hypothetical protein
MKPIKQRDFGDLVKNGGVKPLNLIVLLWWMSGIFSFWFLLYAILIQSWVFSLISAAWFLPIAYYFGGAENDYQLIALFPLIPIVLACVFFWKKNNRRKGT